MSMGVPPSGSGHSPKGGAASCTASPAKPSVPNAERNTLEDYMAEIDAHRRKMNCDWCVGFIRRDCTMFKRCMKTGATHV